MCLWGWFSIHHGAPCVHFHTPTLATEAVIGCSLMERSVELARAWASSAFIIHTDAWKREQKKVSNCVSVGRTDKMMSSWSWWAATLYFIRNDSSIALFFNGTTLKDNANFYCLTSVKCLINACLPSVLLPSRSLPQSRAWGSHCWSCQRTLPDRWLPAPLHP